MRIELISSDHLEEECTRAVIAIDGVETDALILGGRGVNGLDEQALAGAELAFDRISAVHPAREGDPQPDGIQLSGSMIILRGTVLRTLPDGSCDLDVAGHTVLLDAEDMGRTRAQDGDRMYLTAHDPVFIVDVD